MSTATDMISELSSLTRVQLETLKIQRLVQEGKINMESALKMRINSGISRGTHYRILVQGRKNIKESLFTVAMAIQLGLVRPEDIQKLVSVISLVPEDVDQEKLLGVVTLLKVLVDRIVMS